MVNAIFPGTFDPPTLGHLDMMERSSKIFGQVYVAIASDSHKTQPYFTIEERIGFLKTITKQILNLKVVNFDGLLIDFCDKININLIIKGLRNCNDLEFETMMAQANRKLAGIETLYLNADEKYIGISSSLIKEIATHGKRLHHFVPSEIEEVVFNKLSKK